MWKYASYVRKGLSHEKSGIECQDRVLVCENENCIVAALADGLGSLEYSAVASEVATRTVAEFFLSQKMDLEQNSSPEGTDELAHKLIGMVQLRIREKAEALSLAVEAMDCTLGFVCVYKEEQLAIIGRLGDSAVCIIRKEASEVISDTSVSANGTSAVLDSDAGQSLKVLICDLEAKDIQGFILCSDGLDNEVYMKSSRFVQKAAELYFNSVLREDAQQIIGDRVEELVSFENTPFDDDISVAVISREDTELVLPEDPKWLCTCGVRNRMQDTYCCSCGKDIIAIYRHVRFKDYGGKDAFFLWMNQHPEEEKQIMNRNPKAAPGQVPKTEPNNKPNNIKNKKPNEEPSQEPNNDPGEKPDLNSDQNKQSAYRKRVIVAAAAGFLTGFLLGTVVGGIWEIIDWAERDPGVPFTEPTTATAGTVETTAATEAVETTEVTESTAATDETETIETTEATSAAETTEATETTETTEVTETADTAETTEPEEIVDPSELEKSDPSEKVYQELPDGSVYWGAMEEEVPHGRGVLLKKGYYYLGQFSAGKMDGVFTIVSENGYSRISFVEFREDEVSWSEDGGLRRCSVLHSELTLCDRPGGEEICILQKGDVVYRTETPETEVSEIIWVEVIWNNTVGWVPSGTVW